MVGMRFSAAARAAGVERVTAHSGRVGLASELTNRAASTTDVMPETGRRAGWSRTTRPGRPPNAGLWRGTSDPTSRRLTPIRRATPDPPMSAKAASASPTTERQRREPFRAARFHTEELAPGQGPRGCAPEIRSRSTSANTQRPTEPREFPERPAGRRAGGRSSAPSSRRATGTGPAERSTTAGGDVARALVALERYRPRRTRPTGPTHTAQAMSVTPPPAARPTLDGPEIHRRRPYF